MSQEVRSHVAQTAEQFIEGRRQGALKSLQLAEHLLAATLDERIPEGSPLRASWVCALESVRAAALHLEPTQGEA